MADPVSGLANPRGGRPGAQPSTPSLDRLTRDPGYPALLAISSNRQFLRNRVIMAPLTRCRSSPEGVPVNPLMTTYYAERASAGLIISEATLVVPEGRGYPCTPGIFNAEQVEAWKPITSAVHAAGGLIVCQLWHCGRTAAEGLIGTKPVAPSAMETRPS